MRNCWCVALHYVTIKNRGYLPLFFCYIKNVREKYTQSELDKILLNTSQRLGWNFSSMKTWRAPVPWDFLKEVKKYLKPTMDVLDIGTGGGERFIQLSDIYKSGMGTDVDPAMIDIARKNAQAVDNVEFIVSSDKLTKIEKNFNIILDRHAPFDLTAIFNHLKPRGYFISQQVGEKNMLNIKKVLEQKYDIPIITKDEVQKSGLRIVTFQEYDVEYVVKDIESLIFWLKALDMLHADIATDKVIDNVEILNAILKGNVDKRGFVTNEHRYLVIAEK